MSEVEEPFTDWERHRLIQCVMTAMSLAPGGKDDELHAIVAKLVGTDTVIVARRAYPSASR